MTVLTQKDLDNIRLLIGEELDTKLEEKLEEKLGALPTKDEFYIKMDEVMGELKTIREEQTVLSYRQSKHTDQLDNHEERIGNLEKLPTS